MTYAELGQARGISTSSATRLAFRRKWRRQQGNDGAARVAVPVGEDKPADDDRTTKRGDITPAIRVLETAVSSLTEAREAADRRADAAEARADRAEAGREAADRRADALQARLEAVDAARQQAEQAAEERRQADAARRSLGRLARLRAAWRGE
jgi:hypothetical protein